MKFTKSVIFLKISQIILSFVLNVLLGLSIIKICYSFRVNEFILKKFCSKSGRNLNGLKIL
ncbi:hypothetical protein NEF87_001600 [Candidatus Lokiarchaeum ossiferum]|uniref:Uncharacterized protein n=1 Tax=Candidatus Lokiarchaeum ossiferum TaxID=2951803 RepID=A0ABY6HP65_9ARCH|nr:hypothetical protein NEF87_001600 [Candidatus Lokiarchaeum sp. B-35]